MMQLLIQIFKRVYRLFGDIAGWIRLAQCDCETGGQVSIARQVRVRATDGGTARLGQGVSIDRYADITVKNGRLEIGANSYIGQHSVICAREAITIGSDCLIAEHVTIRDQDHRFGPGLITARAGFNNAPVTIGDNVWLGAKVTVLKGVTIGNNVVVGANSVVTRDLPANVVAAGNPARVLKQIRRAPQTGAE